MQKYPQLVCLQPTLQSPALGNRCRAGSNSTWKGTLHADSSFGRNKCGIACPRGEHVLCVPQDFTGRGQTESVMRERLLALKIGVLMGGLSREREISLRSGGRVIMSFFPSFLARRRGWVKRNCTPTMYKVLLSGRNGGKKLPEEVSSVTSSGDNFFSG